MVANPNRLAADTLSMEPAITVLTPAPAAGARPILAAAHQRAEGEVRLSAGPDGDRTRLRDFRQAGSLRCLFPRREPGRLDAMLLNTGGGLIGGDRFTVRAEALPGARLALTTQTAERAYAALPGERSVVRTRLNVGAGARLDWLPQETILFESAALDRRLTVSLAAGARLLLVEPLVFGRTARGEQLREARLKDRLVIDREGVPLWRDGIDLAGDVSARLDSGSTAGGARALATLLFVAPEAEAHLDGVRAALPETGGASLVAQDLLALRVLAPDGYSLRRTLLPVLDRLTGGDLPKPWRM